MEITWYGNAGIAIQAGNASVIFDPFLKYENPGFSNTLSDFDRYDRIFITHGHLDHLATVPDLVKNTNKKVYCTKVPAQALLKHKVNRVNISEIKAYDVIKIEDMKIIVYPGKHIRFELGIILKTLFSPRIIKYRKNLKIIMELNREYREDDETVAYLVEQGTERVFILGSCGLRNGIKYPENVDLLVVPLQGSTRIVGIAEKLVKRINPGKIVLDHFDDSFPPVSGFMDPEKFVRVIKGQYNIEVIVPEYNKVIKL